MKRNKTDAADAEAICEAVARPNMRFVPIKTVEQQGILALHRVRSLLVRRRTAAVNAARGLLAEFCAVAGKRIQRVDESPTRMPLDRDADRPALTPRQAEVLDLVGRGLSNKMIGRRLGLSEHTVRGHVQALLVVLGVARRAEAVFKARQLGLIR